MDDSCHWECKETTTASYPDNYTTTSKDPNDEKFCLGGTDMYMQGFSVSFLGKKTIQAINNSIIILDFQQWERYLCDFAFQQLDLGHKDKVHLWMCRSGNFR